ncbi:MAG: hypothetical protein QM757_10140 [Paludibaculum sp.]
MIVKFAGYGFNKSHSTAYGADRLSDRVISRRTIPAEFMAALLSCGMESTERISEHSDDARRMKLAILPPSVNLSDVEFSVITSRWRSRDCWPNSNPNGKTPAKEGESARSHPAPAEIKGRIAFGLGAVRGVGEACMRCIVAERTANGDTRTFSTSLNASIPKS